MLGVEGEWTWKQTQYENSKVEIKWILPNMLLKKIIKAFSLSSCFVWEHLVVMNSWDLQGLGTVVPKHLLQRHMSESTEGCSAWCHLKSIITVVFAPCTKVRSWTLLRRQAGIYRNRATWRKRGRTILSFPQILVLSVQLFGCPHRNTGAARDSPREGWEVIHPEI